MLPEHSRRDFLVAGLAAGALARAARADVPGPQDSGRPSPAGSETSPGARGGKHSVCRWCYGGIPLDELCSIATRCGVQSIELLSEPDWAIVQQRGLDCAVANGPCSIQKGINRVENHDAIVQEAERLLPLVGRAGIPNMIIFSGNRAGLSDAEGLENCATALRRIVPAAEAANVTVIMELLNSKVDHKDYQCDRTPWGVELCKRVDSTRFRLLYDIYHMQIMEGDVIRTIKSYAPYIAHYHTGGVPGRNEIDVSQELYYPAIAQAIAATGYTGYIGQEFIPRRDPEDSLRQAVGLCTVDT